MAGLVNVCVHKGLFPPSVSARFPNLVDYADVRDVGKAAKVCHGGPIRSNIESLHSPKERP